MSYIENLVSAAIVAPLFVWCASATIRLGPGDWTRDEHPRPAGDRDPERLVFASDELGAAAALADERPDARERASRPTERDGSPALRVVRQPAARRRVTRARGGGTRRTSAGSAIDAPYLRLVDAGDPPEVDASR